MMRDPFQPSLPTKNEEGRLFTYPAIQPGWSCRLCKLPMGVDKRGFTVCAVCDAPAPTAAA